MRLNSRLPTSGGKQISFCSATLAIALDRESHGKVSCDELCPNADFEYLRRSSKPKRTAIEIIIHLRLMCVYVKFKEVFTYE